MGDTKIRLQKFMADCGIASRRASEKLIEEGKVRVNKEIAHIGMSIDPEKDNIYVQGKKIKLRNNKKYIILNKPRGYVTTMSDEMGRKCVAELVKDVNDRIYPIGRLDKNSEGLLIMTNDGEFANLISHPKNHIPKVYRVTVRPDVNEEQLKALRTGVKIDDEITSPAEVRVITQEEGRTVLKMTIYEGKNRQIRRMCESLGLEVARLKRIAIGHIKLGMLKPSKWRNLSESEVLSLIPNNI